MSEWKVPSWLENYNTPTGAQAGQDFSNTFLKPVADTVTGISNQYNKDKIDEILDRASKESAWTKKEIDYTDIGNKLLPYDRDLAEKYLTKGKEQQAAQSKIDTNKAIAAAFNKPKEDYTIALEAWKSKSTDKKGLEDELAKAEDELAKLNDALIELIKTDSGQVDFNNTYIKPVSYKFNPPVDLSNPQLNMADDANKIADEKAKMQYNLNSYLPSVK